MITYVVNEETGEIEDVHVKDGFMVKDAETADWVMEQMLDADTEIVKAKAILANAQAMVKAAERRREALEWRFGIELSEWARGQIKDGKTWRSQFGTVAFRTQPERVAVVDEAKAIEWARNGCPSAIKITEKFLVSMLPKGVVGDGMELKPECETHSIKTGVK